MRTHAPSCLIQISLHPQIQVLPYSKFGLWYTTVQMLQLRLIEWPIRVEQLVIYQDFYRTKQVHHQN